MKKPKRYFEIIYDGSYTHIEEITENDAFWFNEHTKTSHLKSDCFDNFSEAKKALIEYFQGHVETYRYVLRKAKELKKGDFNGNA